MKMDEFTSSSKHTFLDLMVAQHNSELESTRIEIQGVMRYLGIWGAIGFLPNAACLVPAMQVQ